jgi:hypothetical protein
MATKPMALRPRLTSLTMGPSSIMETRLTLQER